MAIAALILLLLIGYLTMFFRCISYATPNGRFIVNDELGRLSKEAVVICCKVLSRNLRGRTEENRKKLGQDSHPRPK
jgi:hypothetical protein